MTQWVEAVGAALLALSGVALGYWFSRLRKPYWIIGYLIPLILILLYIAAFQFPRIAFVPPGSWMLTGRNKFSVFGFICGMLLMTPLARLPQKRNRIAVTVLMFIAVGLVAVAPFVAAALNRDYLTALTTNMDADGVCRQSDNYNCGPATAVTALRRLGLPAEISEIAILCRANALTGTDPDVIARVLRKRYGPEGLSVENRVFQNLAELKAAGVTMTFIQLEYLTDHAVTIFEVTEDEVVVGDPLSGIKRMSHEDFLSSWYYFGTVLKLQPRI